MSRWRSGLCVFCIAGMSVLIFGGATGSAKVSQKKPFIIGMATSSTGFMSFYDVPASKGAEIGAAEYNKKGGILGRPIKLVYVDSKTDPVASAAAGQQLVDKGASAIMTITDYDLGGPAARIAQKNGRLSFSGAGSPHFGVAGIGSLAYDVNAGTPTQGASAAQAVKELGWKKPYLLEDTSLEFTKTLCSYFKDAWAHIGKTPIAGHDTFGQGDVSIATQVTRIKTSSSSPDVIVLCSYPPGGATAIRQIRNAGIKTPIMTFEPFDGTFWTKAVPKVSDVYHLAEGSLYGDDPRPAVNRFFAAYKKRFGPAPQSYSLFGYQMVEMLVKGAQRAKSSDPRRIAAALNTFKNMPTTLGPTTYTAKCHEPTGRPYPLMRWQNGVDRFVKMIRPSFIPKALC
jgi:branched-chain amino acid transport system substrate-binding protein